MEDVDAQIIAERVAPAARGREDDFVAALAELEPSAWRRLSEEHYRRVHHYAYVRTGSTSDADDVAANVFVAAVKGIRGLRHRDVPIAAWLLGIAHNETVDVLNRRARAVTASLAYPEVAESRRPPDEITSAGKRRDPATRALGWLTALRARPLVYQGLAVLGAILLFGALGAGASAATGAAPEPVRAFLHLTDTPPPPARISGTVASMDEAVGATPAAPPRHDRRGATVSEAPGVAAPNPEEAEHSAVGDGVRPSSPIESASTATPTDAPTPVATLTSDDAPATVPTLVPEPTSTPDMPTSTSEHAGASVPTETEMPDPAP